MIKKKQTNKKAKINKSLSNKIEKAMSYITNQRVKEVIENRFGLKGDKPKTLEEIGKKYGITRERVRQIQNSGIKILKSDKIMSLLDSVFVEIDNLFAEHGYLIGEDYLYSFVSGSSEPHPLRGGLYLILTLGDPYKRIINDPRFYTYWTTDELARDRAEKVVDFLIDNFNKKGQVLNESEVLEMLNKKHSALPVNLFNVVLDLAKEIEKNKFGEVGLVHWPEITPQGVKDKAYLVLKKTGEPLHFTEIANLINKMGISEREAYAQTVHNELIRDPRFVLVGRGSYALSDWGYEPGTVSDILEKILQKTKRPMTKEEILKEVLSQRIVKPNTIVLNLHRSSKIQKLPDGKYSII